MIRNPGKKKLKGTDVRETPRPLYAELNAEFRFTLDAAATGERVWCNPPFTELLAWTDKAWEEQTDAHVIVMLVPSNRNDQPWWQKNVAPYVKKPGFDVRWFAERHRFTINGGQPILNSQGKVGSPSFSCALLIWS
jgi:PAS domain-containing protein